VYDGGSDLAILVSAVSDAGAFPCTSINQTGGYAGLASFGGLSHPVWTDTRTQLDSFSGCRTGRAMEERRGPATVAYATSCGISVP
jgi:hypothetical protein